MISENTSKRTQIAKKYIFPILLIIACIWDVNKGLDLSDTGYNLERYYNYFTYDASSRLSKFWSDYIGHLLIQMPGGDSWLGMSIYCTTIIIAIVLVAYYFSCMFLESYVVFVCEIVAVSLYWIPAIVLYDSLSFLLLEIAIVLIYYALKLDDIKKFFGAGVVLGVNTLVRMPNVTYIILILWVWLYAWLYRDALKKIGSMPWVISRTLGCVSGYLVGIGGSFIYSLKFSDFSAYFKTLNHLSGNTKVAGYTLGEMAFGTIAYILEQAKYIVLLGGVIIVAIFAIYIVNRISKKEIRVFGKSVIYFLVIVASVVIIFVFYHKYRWFSMDYNQYSSIKSIMALVYLWGIIISIVNCLWNCRKYESMISLLYISLLWVIPLGSNNQIYLDIANSFMLLPMICYLTKALLEKIYVLEHKKKLEINMSIKLVMGVFCIFMLFQTILFGLTFSFHDSDIDTKIEENNAVYGMRTSQEKAIAVSRLLKFIKKEEIAYSSIIQYCNSPGLYYLLKTQRGIPHSWPELPTCRLEILDDELEALKESGDFPIIIVTDEFADFYQKIYCCEDVEIDTELEIEYFYDEKKRLLMDFMSANYYSLVYNDKNMYAIYVVDK